MGNALNEAGDTIDRFLICGHTGSGKTTLFTSLPGKKFMYIFDPNAHSSIVGHDIDYEEFNVEIDDVDLSIKTLKADTGDRTSRRIEPMTYMKWEKHFEEHHESGFFEQYDWVGMDSFTLFQDIIMDRLLYLNKRTGKQPEQADWAAQVNTVSNVFRVLANQRVGLYCTGHVDMRQDDISKKVYNRFMMTGKLRVRIPLLFNNVLISHSNSDEKHIEYLLQTRSDKEYPVVRTHLKGLDMFEDITIKDFSNPTAYGLGALLKKGHHGATTSNRK